MERRLHKNTAKQLPKRSMISISLVRLSAESMHNQIRNLSPRNPEILDLPA